MKVAECSDVEFLRNTVEKLWDIIDDIDTYSDMAKANDQVYRRLVEKRQAKRWDLGIVTDGYSLFRKVPDQESP